MDMSSDTRIPENRADTPLKCRPYVLKCRQHIVRGIYASSLFKKAFEYGARASQGLP
jgi:hypothetical protein